MAGTPVTRTGLREQALGNEPLSVLLVGDEHDLTVGYALEVLAVGALAVTIRGLHELVARDPTILEGDLLHDRDRQTLRTLHGTHELPRLEQRIHRTGIQPRVTTTQRTHIQHARIQIHAVQIRDLQLATRARLHPLRVLDHVLVVEIQAGHRVMRLRMGRLLLDRHGLPILIELNHAIPFRIVDIIAEHARAPAGLGLRDRATQRRAQAIAVEDVVTQHQRARLARDELLAQQERLRETVRRRLHLVREPHTIMRTITQEPLEVRQILRRADDQDVTDPGHHQHTQRIVDHRIFFTNLCSSPITQLIQILQRDRSIDMQLRIGEVHERVRLLLLQVRCVFTRYVYTAPSSNP